MDTDAASTLRIRPARPEEADALSDLATRSKAVWDYDAAFLALCRTALRVKFENVLAWPYHVAERDGQLLGFYGFEPVPEGIGLDFMFVAPEAIGQGVGRALWDHAVATARALGYETLMVVADPNAEGFYRRMGARTVGAQPSDLQPGRFLPVLRFQLRAAT